MKFLLLALTIIAFFSCQVNNEGKDIAPLSDSTSITGLTGDSVKLVKTAGIQCKVRNVEQGLKQLSTLAATHGGAVFHQAYTAAEGERRELQLSTDSLLVISVVRPQADVIIRVPSPQLETFLFAAADLGYYTSTSNLQVDDKSLEFLSNSLKQEVRSDAFETLATAKQKPAITKSAIEVADEAINHLVAAKTIDADANYSRINLTLFQNATVRRETIANYALADYSLPFSQRLSDALNSGWNGFLQLLLAVMHLWVFVLLGLVAFLLYRRWTVKAKPLVATEA